MLITMSFPPDEARARSGPHTRKPDLSKDSRAGRKAPQPPALDADDLRRRLVVVLAQQQAKEEKKRQIRAKEAHRKAKAERTARRGPGNPSEAAAVPPPKREESPSLAVKEVDSSRSRQPKSKATNSSHAALQPRELRPRSDRPRPKSTADDATTSKPQAESGMAFHPYVPRVAASQFSDTTISDGAREKPAALKQSGKALRLHLESTKTGPVASGPAHAGMPEQPKSLRKSKSSKEKLSLKHQSQGAQSDSTTADHDHRRGEKSHNRHTVPANLLKLNVRAEVPTRSTSRRKSTGDLLTAVDSRRHPALDPAFILNKPTTSDGVLDHHAVAEEHRVDWTQSDESKSRARDRIMPLLKKADSIWALRGRFGKHSREDKPDASHKDVGSDVLEDCDDQGETKSPKTGFFARFKR